MSEIFFFWDAFNFKKRKWAIKGNFLSETTFPNFGLETTVTVSRRQRTLYLLWPPSFEVSKEKQPHVLMGLTVIALLPGGAEVPAAPHQSNPSPPSWALTFFVTMLPCSSVNCSSVTCSPGIS